ncbi:hypothetical protein HDU76_011265, partial [Blyttiomyces sp. JEL0837]
HCTTNQKVLNSRHLNPHNPKRTPPLQRPTRPSTNTNPTPTATKSPRRNNHRIQRKQQRPKLRRI